MTVKFGAVDTGKLYLAADSDPTAADANKNDFSFNTSFGWSF